MADAARAQIIHPPDRLRARLGARFGGIDAEAISRAEAALEALSGQFAGWLEEEVVRLEAARIRLHAAAGDVESLRELHLRAHDLKGLGGTYGFPLVTRICASLCRLTDSEAPEAPLTLVGAHVDAVRALVRDDVRDPAHPVGRAVCEALEAQVAAHRAGGDPLPLTGVEGARRPRV